MPLQRFRECAYRITIYAILVEPPAIRTLSARMGRIRISGYSGVTHCTASDSLDCNPVCLLESLEKSSASRIDLHSVAARIKLECSAVAGSIRSQVD
jgi:hypothetical protein